MKKNLIFSGGFYRHLYEQKLGSDKPQREVVTTEESKPEFKLKDNKPDNSTKKRNYRKQRKSSHGGNMSEGEIEESDEEVNHFHPSKKKAKQPEENIDADSDFSIDDSSNDENKPSTPTPKPSVEDEFKKPENKVDRAKTSEFEIKAPEPIIEEKVKPKIDIWKKRTVGEVFEQALKRYYERKAARGT